MNNGWQQFASFINGYEVGTILSRQQFLAWAHIHELAEGSVDGYRNQLVHTGYLRLGKRGTYELVNKIPVGTTTTEIQMLLSGDRLQYLEKVVARKEKAQHDAERKAKHDALVATNQRIVSEAKSRSCLDCKRSFPTAVMQFSYRQVPRWHRTLFKLILNDTHNLVDEIGMCDVICMNCHIIRNSASILS